MIPFDYLSAWKRLRAHIDTTVARVDTAKVINEDIATIDAALEQLCQVTREKGEG